MNEEQRKFLETEVKNLTIHLHHKVVAYQNDKKYYLGMLARNRKDIRKMQDEIASLSENLSPENLSGISANVCKELTIQTAELS